MPVTHEIWLKTDLKRPITVQPLHGLLFSADNQGDKVGFEVYDNGSPVTLSGVITGYIIKNNGETVVVSGSFDGNRAWIVCPANAYDAIGPVYIAIKSRASTATTAITTTLGMCTTYVERTATGEIVTPTYKIVDAATIASMITQMETATNAATAAASSANTAAAAANTAAGRTENMDATATTLAPGSAATANVSTVSGHYRIAIGVPKGDIGPVAEITGTPTSTYQVGDDGTSIPTGTWLDNIPVVPQGKFLWTRTVIAWNNGQSTTIYTPSRQGRDGSGSVSSVNNVSPDSNGNVALPIDDAPTAGSDNPVKSGALKAALDKNIASIGANPITSVSDDTRAFWVNKGTCYAYINVADCLHGQPYQFGFLVSYVYGDNVYQEFYSTNDFTGPYYRFANGSQTAMPSFEAKTKEGSITFASGIATASDTRYPTKVFRNGNVICLQAAVQTTDDSNFSNTYRELFTLPVGYRPAHRIMAAGCVGNSIWNQTFAAKINIESGGAVSVYIPSNSATNANMCQFCVSFIV